MNNRPRIKLSLTKSDRIIETTGWVSIIALWLLAILSYINLPNTIAVHFNAAGNADRFGGKGHVFILAAIPTVLYVGMTILNKYPYLFNYPTKITPENAFMQYTNATRMIRFLKLTVVVVFGLIMLHIIGNSSGGNNSLGKWLLPTIMGLIFLPLTYYLIKLLKDSKA